MNSSGMMHYCKFCDYTNSIKKDFNKHLLSKKHIMNVENKPSSKDKTITALSNVLERVNAVNPYDCENCGKSYRDKSGLWRHNKKCIPPQKDVDNNMINLLIEQNQELQKQVIELAKQNAVINNTTTTTNSNNTTNNQFNMNIFLNETCKDAINLSEFMNSINLQLEDLETTARLGYVEGISRILIRALKDMDVGRRPIHCTDVKRETVYVKDQDNWEKELPDKTNLKRAVNFIADQNLSQIDKWKQENPKWGDNESQESQVLNKIYITALGGENPDEDKKFMDKIIKNVLHEVVVDKK